MDNEFASSDTLSSDQLRQKLHDLNARVRELSKDNKELQSKLKDHQETEDELRGSIQHQKVMNALLQLSLGDCSLEKLLKQIIDHIVTLPDLMLDPSGIIFLRQKDSEYLELKAQVNVSDELIRVCSRRRIGECLCGRAALSGEVIFAPSSDPRHEIVYEGMQPHTHYCVPIVNPKKEVLGVLALFVKDGCPRNRSVEKTLLASGKVIARIIERTRAMKALHVQTELVSSIYEAADNVAFITTNLVEKDTRITSFSRGAERMFGHSMSDAVGAPISLLYPPGNGKLIQTTVSRLRAGQKIYFQNRVMVRRSGEHFTVALSIHPLFDCEGKVTGSLGVCLDISDLKLVQTALKKANEELEQRVQERTLELQKAQQQFLHAEKLGAIGRLSAALAHEFNNPIQGILTVLNGIARRAPLEKEDEKLVWSAIEECKRVTGLIRDLQDFNRPTSGKKELMDIRTAIDSILHLFKSDCKRKKISLVTEYAEDTTLIMAVPDQIKQVILNLLNNAGDACPDGGIIHVFIQPKDNEVMVKIKDTGTGIRPEDLGRIFEPFYTTKSGVKGNGLGLPVSYGIIKRHNGRIEVESEPGKGSTFTIFLPAAGVPNEA